MTATAAGHGAAERDVVASRDPWLRALLFWCSVPPLVCALWAGSCVLGLGGWETSWSGMLLGLHVVIALASFPVAFVLVLISKTRVAGVRMVVAACWSVFACVLAAIGGNALRMKGFELAAERAQPLVRAIERYELELGAPPSALSALLPGYLDAIPDGLPELSITTNPQEALGRRWMLCASCPSGPFNWDCFVYLPDQQYPERAFGGRLQRVGAWAYVHE
jgi:hypothetical protein